MSRRQFVAWVTGMGTTPAQITLLMLVIWIVAGMFMEASPTSWSSDRCVSARKQIGMDPIHFCVFMITTLGLGFITPPFGLNLFVMAGLTRTSITAIGRQAFPFVIAMIIVSVIIGFVPAISLFTLNR